MSRVIHAVAVRYLLFGIVYAVTYGRVSFWLFPKYVLLWM